MPVHLVAFRALIFVGASIMETISCACGRTVPRLSNHRPGRAHPVAAGLKRPDRKGMWCPETDLRKKAEEEAKAAQEKASLEAPLVVPAPQGAQEAPEVAQPPAGA